MNTQSLPPAAEGTPEFYVTLIGRYENILSVDTTLRGFAPGGIGAPPLAPPDWWDSIWRSAQTYAELGWPVFPCEPRGKRPLTEHGLKDGTTDRLKLDHWWTASPEANIGHPTGQHVVIDVDGIEGEVALWLLEKKYGPLPDTLIALTGKGRHLWFMSNGQEIRNSAGKLGSHLDVRGEGGYVIVPPSVHENGKRYEWLDRFATPAPLPDWLALLLTESARPQLPATGTGEKIPAGQRHAHLLSLAGTLRTKGCDEATIAAALLTENTARCSPPKPEAEVRKLAHDVYTRYPAGAPQRNPQPPCNVWDHIESLDTFLNTEVDGADFLDDEKRILVRESVTEIFAPRGLGKSLYALWLAVSRARRGLRVLLMDRDNPRHVVRDRLRAFGAAGVSTLQVITREKCPPLTNAAAWSIFPYAEYDLVILDSLDSAAEGIGEQDSSKPSRAIAPLLDIARRENGPAVLILGNTIKSAQHSRGSGVIEDRADIVYEVRDATDFHPSGSKPWVEELPPAGADSWASRSSRRKEREKYRLAFISTKFRIGQEPEPSSWRSTLPPNPGRFGT